MTPRLTRNREITQAQAQKKQKCWVVFAKPGVGRRRVHLSWLKLFFVLGTQMNAATRYTKLPLVVIYYSLDFSLQYREGTQFWRNKVLDIAHKVVG